MNFYSFIGLGIALGILFFGLRLSSDDLKIFFDGPSLFIVFGGIFAASAIAFQLNKMKHLAGVFLSQFLGRESINNAQVIKNIMQICEKVRSGEEVVNVVSNAKDPFLKEGLEMLADAVVEREAVVRIMEKRASQLNYLRGEDVKKVRTLSKFPPAFGMMGTTIGMIVLLANLGGADAMKTIGPAMGVCLITTLYGVAFANLVVIPISENIEELTRQNQLKRKIIIEGLKHILEQNDPILVAEDLNSFLLPNDRLDWKASVG